MLWCLITCSFWFLKCWLVNCWYSSRDLLEIWVGFFPLVSASLWFDCAWFGFYALNALSGLHDLPYKMIFHGWFSFFLLCDLVWDIKWSLTLGRELILLLCNSVPQKKFSCSGLFWVLEYLCNLVVIEMFPFSDCFLHFVEFLKLIGIEMSKRFLFCWHWDWYLCQSATSDYWVKETIFAPAIFYLRVKAHGLGSFPLSSPFLGDHSTVVCYDSFILFLQPFCRLCSCSLGVCVGKPDDLWESLQLFTLFFKHGITFFVFLDMDICSFLGIAYYDLGWIWFSCLQLFWLWRYDVF